MGEHTEKLLRAVLGAGPTGLTGPLRELVHRSKRSGSGPGPGPEPERRKWRELTDQEVLDYGTIAGSHTQDPNRSVEDALHRANGGLGAGPTETPLSWRPMASLGAGAGREFSRNPGRPQLGARAFTESLRLPGVRKWWPVWLVVVGLAVVLGVRVATVVLDWAHERLWDMQYGVPRTVHWEGPAGFRGETSGGGLTRIVTVNYGDGAGSGSGVVFVLPAGRVEGAFVLQVAVERGDTGPLGVEFADVDKDGIPDLLVADGYGGVVPFLMDTGRQVYRPPTVDEMKRISLPLP